MVLITDKKVPNRLARVKSQPVKKQVRPTIDNESYESEEGMMSMEELEATLALISKKIRDLSRR